jgi:prepilin-type N-terminal cleavage/methylation domain-containing protein
MRGSRGFTLIELLIVIAIIGILSSMATVAYQHAKMRGAETSAVTSLNAINNAQFAYMQACGGERYYAPTLAALAAPVPGSGAGFLSPDLGQADPLTKSGYVIKLTATEVPDVQPACSGAAPASGYQVTADPLIEGVSGRRFYGTNSDRIIFEDTATFAGNMPETGPPPHGQEIK